MSHFTVVVVGDNIEQQMAPYAEQDFEDKYGVFNDFEEQGLEEYNNKPVDIVVLSDGTLYSKYNEKFRHFNPQNFDTDYVYPTDSIIREGKFNELYPTFEEFMEQWRGYSSRDEKMGLYGHWSNPNAKWDWFKIGGRWTGYFKPMQAGYGKLGKPGSTDNKPIKYWVDSIQLKNIDIEGMKKFNIDQANDTYDKIEKILKGRIYPSWQHVLEKHEGNIEAAREEYNNHEVIKDFNKAGFYIWGNFHEIYGNSREEYVKKCSNSTMVPYAFVKDGKWYQKGEMGWFGMSDDKMTQDEWNHQFWEMINSLDPNTTLTLLDCHI